MSSVHWLVAAALLVVGAALRWGELAPESLWFDDAWVALVKDADGLGRVFEMSYTTPGYGLLMKGWLSLVGFSELRAQLPAFVFGIITAPALYLFLVRRHIQPCLAGLGALLILASPMHASFSTRAKQYAIEGFVVLVLLAVAWWLLDAPDERRRWLVWTVSAIAATVFSAALVPVVAAGYLAGGVSIFLHRRERGGRARMLSGAVATGTYALFGLLWWLLAVAPNVPAALFGRKDMDFIHLFSAGPSTALSDFDAVTQRLLDGFSVLPALAVGAALVVAALWLVRRRPALGALLVCPVVIAIGLSVLELTPLGEGRTDVYLYPSLAMLVAVGLDAGGRVTERTSLIAVALAAVVIAASFFEAPLVFEYPNQNLKPFLAEMQGEVRESDGVIVTWAAQYGFALYGGFETEIFEDPDRAGYYPYLVEATDDNVTILERQPGRPEEYGPVVADVASRHPRVWLVNVRLDDRGDHEDEIEMERILRESGKVLTKKEVDGEAVIELWED